MQNFSSKDKNYEQYHILQEMEKAFKRNLKKLFKN